ncbi:MAG: spermidine/putrescine ABC transporter substrate-binding protein [Proteobacteria bacterium]|nr:spermidine/putrescine ABC transporter substrate-binding protein [Pseudomonadota bacterium]
MSKIIGHLPASKFLEELRRYQKGSVSRRHFLGVTGLGLATAVMSSAVPGLRPRKAYAALSGTVNFTTWPSYFAQENLDNFTKDTGVKINVAVFGSNEEMLAKLQAGSTGWDVFVPTNYTISTYHELGLIDPLDLARLPNYDAAQVDDRFKGEGIIGGSTYAVPKDWGTTGFVYNSKSAAEKPTTWKEFWDLAQKEWTGRVMVHDYQLTTIGNALKYFGYSFNSNDEKELADAEKLMLAAKPHLFGINSDYKPSLAAGDAWASVCWTGDAVQLQRDQPEFVYVLAKEGGEIWTDYYAIPKGGQNVDAAYALIDYLLQPPNNVKEGIAHGYPICDKRAISMMPKELLDNPVLYPAAEALAPLEFGAAATLVNPLRAEIMARFKAA